MHFPFDNHWTLFLDRDGVINRKIDNDYVKTWETFEFLPGVLSALGRFAAVFGRILVVTNQQGIGKGLYTPDDLDQIHAKMLDAVRKAGGRIDKVYYCPALEKENSECRKPNTGMALQAQKDFPEITFTRSLIVGDSLTDLEFGKRLNMKTIFINSHLPVPPMADAMYRDLFSFSDSLLHNTHIKKQF